MVYCFWVRITLHFSQKLKKIAWFMHTSVLMRTSLSLSLRIVITMRKMLMQRLNFKIIHLWAITSNKT